MELVDFLRLRAERNDRLRADWREGKGTALVSAHPCSACGARRAYWQSFDGHLCARCAEQAS